MGFIGPVDTVPSIAGFTNFGRVQSPIAPGIKLYLDPRFFKDVVHLVARDECRANFALSNVNPDYPEYVFPGVHSDIPVVAISTKSGMRIGQSHAET